MKVIFGQNGKVINVANATEESVSDVVTWLVPDSSTINVGDDFDANDPKIEAVDKLFFQILFELVNTTRQLTRALRNTSTAANNAATAAGLPTVANSGDVTLAQFRAYCKARL